MIAALVVSAWLPAVMAAGGGGLLSVLHQEHRRTDRGAVAEWANTVIDLPPAAPAFVPLPEEPACLHGPRRHVGFATTVPWVFCLGGAALQSSGSLRRPLTRDGRRGTVLTFAAPDDQRCRLSGPCMRSSP